MEELTGTPQSSRRFFFNGLSAQKTKSTADRIRSTFGLGGSSKPDTPVTPRKRVPSFREAKNSPSKSCSVEKTTFDAQSTAEFVESDLSLRRLRKKKKTTSKLSYSHHSYRRLRRAASSLSSLSTTTGIDEANYSMERGRGRLTTIIRDDAHRRSRESSRSPAHHKCRCSCARQLNMLDAKFEQLKEAFLTELNTSDSITDRKISDLGERHSQKISSVDKYCKESLSVERSECLQRIDKRSVHERLYIINKIKNVEARIEESLRQWADERYELVRKPRHHSESDLNLKLLSPPTNKNIEILSSSYESANFSLPQTPTKRIKCEGLISRTNSFGKREKNRTRTIIAGEMISPLEGLSFHPRIEKRYGSLANSETKSQSSEGSESSERIVDALAKRMEDMYSKRFGRVEELIDDNSDLYNRITELEKAIAIAQLKSNNS